MRRALLQTLFGLILAGNIAADEARVAPDWTMQSASGGAVTLSEVAAERPVILIFWATWCPYCKALMPHIQSMLVEYGDAISVLAIHFRDDKGDPIAFVENAGYDFTVLPDGDDIAKLNGIWGTPGVLIVDRNRHVRFDLYELPKLEFPTEGKQSSHGYKAARLAPYWAAEIRRSLDRVLAAGD